MKTLLVFLSSATVLITAVVSSGCPLDVATVFSLAFVSSLAGLSAADYGRKPNGRAATAAPARLSIRRPRTSAGFASVIIFETTCA